MGRLEKVDLKKGKMVILDLELMIGMFVMDYLVIYK